MEFTGGICHRYLPVNTGMDNTLKSGVYRHLLAFINISLICRLFANDSYCSSIIPYMLMWKITIHVVTFSINQ